MKLSKHKPIPDGFTSDDIRIESSTCTGEKTIGFYCPSDQKLHYAEFVRTLSDIEGFYRQYGLSSAPHTKL